MVNYLSWCYKNREDLSWPVKENALPVKVFKHERQNTFLLFWE